KRLEPGDVEVVRIEVDDIRATACDDHTVAELLAELRDVDLHGLHGPGGGLAGPQLVDDAIDGERLPALEEQHGEQCARFLRAERDEARVALDEKFAEKAELHVVLSHSCGTLSLPALCRAQPVHSRDAPPLPQSAPKPGHGRSDG